MRTFQDLVLFQRCEDDYDFPELDEELHRFMLNLEVRRDLYWSCNFLLGYCNCKRSCRDVYTLYSKHSRENIIRISIFPRFHCFGWKIDFYRYYDQPSRNSFVFKSRFYYFHSRFRNHERKNANDSFWFENFMYPFTFQSKNFYYLRLQCSGILNTVKRFGEHKIRVTNRSRAAFECIETAWSCRYALHKHYTHLYSEKAT